MKDMNEKEILRHVDHTLLSQEAVWDEIRQVCDDAVKYDTASVCIPPSYVKQAAEYVGGRVPICTVIGFPNGYETTAVKEFETKDAIANGADEIDMVINIGWLKDRKYDQIEEEIPQADVAVLSGPSHAEEVGRKLPTTCVIGAKTKKTAEYLQSAFINKVFRVYTSPDILGIELGGSLKNVIALAAGIADGLGYGDNTKAALITRGIAEIARLGVKMGGKIETFTGLTGIGDLIVTCASVHSRNRKAGYLIGQGRSMQEAMDEVQMVVEGVYSAKAAAKLAKKYDVPMPIVEEVNKVLFEGKSPAEAVDDLMLRESRSEHRALQWEK